MTTATRFRRPTELAVGRADDGRLYVLALPDGIPRELNGSAQVIWEVACSGSDQIVRDVAEAYEMDPADVAESVADCIQILVEQRLLEPLGPGQEEL